MKIVGVAFRKWEGLNVCITDYLPLFFLKAAGGTRVEGYYRMQASGPAPFFSIFLIGPKILPKINPRISAQPLAAL